MKTKSAFALSLSLAFTAAVFAVATPTQAAGKRLALVIGNDAYEHAPALDNPKNDAEAVAETLRSVGFEVILKLDADLATTRTGIREFIDLLPTERSDDTVALVFFAGHGVQINGQNFLVPVDAKMARDFEIPDETVSMASVMRGLESAGAGLNLLVLDCCRDNPFGSAWKASRSAGPAGGLAMPKESPQGMFIAFSTSPGDVAEDGEGEHSPYAAALIKHLPTPEKPFEEIFKRVGRDVSESTSGRQQPWFNSKFYGSFTFHPGGEFIFPAPVEDGPATATKSDPFENSLGVEFVPVPGKPGIVMARTETRVADFRAFVRSTGHAPKGGANVFTTVKKPGGGYRTDWVVDESASWENPGFSQSDDHPVTCVSWEDARAFCHWLSEREGRTYRLPTDAEWTAAADTGTRYPWGDSFPPPSESGNYWDIQAIENLPGNWEKSVFGGRNYDDGAEKTAEVASYKANSHGFFDLGGNVWEWCEDTYKKSLNDPALVAKIPVLAEETAEDGTPYRVLRGASWDNFAECDLRTEFRDFDKPDQRDDDYGFRLVLEVR